MGKKQAAQRPAKAAAKLSSATGSSGSKHSKAAKRAKGSSYDALRDPLDRELALLGLRVKNITADGNCFFRALSDQLEGNEHQHSSLRARVVALMQQREDDFAPFVEDDQAFEAYIARMKKEGTWAGHMELQAASLLLEVNIAVYQAGQPRWCIVNFPPGTRQLHLSYHDGEHYNSVRRADDYSPGAPAPIDDLAPVSNAGELQSCWSAADEAIVSAGTGCDNMALIKQQLAAAKGDIDAAIEAIIEILAAEDAGTEAAGAEATAGDADSALSGAVGSPQAAAGAAELAGEQLQQQPVEHCGSVSAAQDIASQAVDTASSQQVEGGAGSSEQQHREAEHEQPTEAAAVDTGQCRASSCSSSEQPATSSNSTSSAEVEARGASGNSSSGMAKPAKAVKGVKLKGGSKMSHSKKAAAAAAAGDAAEPDKRPSRNKPCPCGSIRAAVA